MAPPRPGRPDSRRGGIRIWLAAAFAIVGLLTAGSVYLFVRDSSGRALRTQAADLAVGRTASLADQIENTDPSEVGALLSEASGTDNFEAVAVNNRGLPLSGTSFGSLQPEKTERGAEAITSALGGGRFRAQLPGNLTIVSAPIFSGPRVRGAVLSRSTPSPVLLRAGDAFRDDTLRALAISVAIGILAGFVIASLISIRVKRLAFSAERMAAGNFEVRLPPPGRDEIGDLTTALGTLQKSLRQSFDLLATERDRLSATLDALTDAVIVVGEEGTVRFSNHAAAALIRDGQPDPALKGVLRRAAERGSGENSAVRIEGVVYAIQGRRVPAEEAVLLVARDRTDEIRRDQAEREFVSNAAHELRNPLAGISGVVEVLQGGAKEDPQALDRFLERLAADAERMTRLTQSLLTLARVEAFGELGSVEVVDVSLAAEEAVAGISAPEGVTVRAEVEPELVSEGDPVLLRQVLLGLLSNACKNTPPPGAVTLRAFREGGERTVTIEVEDTGKGIPADEQDRVFERFYRGSDALEAQGFGLGLAIARRMVNIMGGEIGLRSEPGEGSTFWVHLRAAEPTPTPTA